MAEEVMNFEQVVSLQVTVDPDSIKKFLSDLTGLNDEAVKRMSGGSKGVSDSLKELLEERAEVMKSASEKSSTLMDELAEKEISRVDGLIKALADKTRSMESAMRAGGPRADRIGEDEKAEYAKVTAELAVLVGEREKAKASAEEKLRPSRERAAAEELKKFHRGEFDASGIGKAMAIAGGAGSALVAPFAASKAGGAAVDAAGNLAGSVMGNPAAIVGLLTNLKDIAMASYELDRTRSADQLKAAGGGLQFERMATSFAAFETAKRNQTEIQYSGKFSDQEKGEIPGIMGLLQRGAGVNISALHDASKAMDGVRIAADYLGVSLTEAATTSLEYSRVAHVSIQQGLSAIQEAQFTANRLAESNKDAGSFDTAKMTKTLLSLQQHQADLGRSVDDAKVFVEKFSKQLNDGTITVAMAMSALDGGGGKAPMEGAAFTAQRIRQGGDPQFAKLITMLEKIGGGAEAQGAALLAGSGGEKASEFYRSVDITNVKEMKDMAELISKAYGFVARETTIGTMAGGGSEAARMLTEWTRMKQIAPMLNGNQQPAGTQFDASMGLFRFGEKPASEEDRGKTVDTLAAFQKSVVTREQVSADARREVVGAIQIAQEAIVRAISGSSDVPMSDHDAEIMRERKLHPNTELKTAPDMSKTDVAQSGAGGGYGGAGAGGAGGGNVIQVTVNADSKDSGKKLADSITPGIQQKADDHMAQEAAERMRNQGKNNGSGDRAGMSGPGR